MFTETQLRTLQDPTSVKRHECCDKSEESQSGGKHLRYLEHYWQRSPHRGQCWRKKKKKERKVVDYFEEFEAWKSETLKLFYVVIHIQWICPIAKSTVSLDRMVQAID